MRDKTDLYNVADSLSYKPVKVKWSRQFMIKTAHERTQHRLSLTSFTDEEKSKIYQVLYNQEMIKIQRQM